jgi:hypothetical protein
MSNKNHTGLSDKAILLIGALTLIGTIAILIWFFGIVKALIAVGILLGILLGVFVLWIAIDTKKPRRAEEIEMFEIINGSACPKCHRTMRLVEMRAQIGSLDRSAIIGAPVRCPNCGSEFHLFSSLAR